MLSMLGGFMNHELEAFGISMLGTDEFGGLEEVVMLSLDLLLI